MSIQNNKYLHLLRLLRNEKRPLSALRKYQNQNLRSLVFYSYKYVPFYRDLFKKHGVHPDDIKTVADLPKLPIIDKKNFHQNDYPYMVSTSIKKTAKLIPISTSGSSGVSLRFFIDNSYDQYRKAQNVRPYISNGCTHRDRVMKFINTTIPKKKLYEMLGLFKQKYIFSDSDIDTQIKSVTEWQPTIIQGFGSSIGLLASRIKEKQIDKISPRIIFTDSELLHFTLRAFIEKEFATKVIDVYGTMETENIAYECHEHTGYHITIDSVIVEFVKEGIPVDIGEEGEMVCTVLHNYTMPFIRYNLHDVGSFSNVCCPCGSSFPLMNVIEGRSDDYAICENGERKSPRTFLGFFDSFAGLLKEYQIIQENINTFKVLIIPAQVINNDIEFKIKKIMIKEFPRATINISYVDKITRDSSGKFRAFRCLVNSNR